MRHKTAELRPDPFREDLIVYVPVSHETAERCRSSIRAMLCIAARLSNLTFRHGGRVRRRVADASAPPCSPAGIEKIGEGGAETSASQQ
jgi:hypothetical protein